MIRFQDIRREYGGFVALDGLNLEVPSGTIYTLLGPNGAGKTSAMRIAIGLTRPTAGRVWLSKTDVIADPVEARAVSGFLPDNPSYFQHMTADAFLEFLAMARGLEGDGWRPRRDDLLRRLGLDESRHSRMVNYSFGMLRKTALIGALLHAPQHLLLDEPTAGLDPWSVRALKDILKEESARGATLLVSSHDLDAVSEISDRMGIITRGRLIKELDRAAIDACRASGNAALEAVFLEATEGTVGEIARGP